VEQRPLPGREPSAAQDQLGGEATGLGCAVRKAQPKTRRSLTPNEAWAPDNLAHKTSPPAPMPVSPCSSKHSAAGKTIRWRAIKRPLAVGADESVHDRASLDGLSRPYDASNIKIDKHRGLTEGWRWPTPRMRLGFGTLMIGCMVLNVAGNGDGMLLASAARLRCSTGTLLLAATDRDGGLRYDAAACIEGPTLGLEERAVCRASHIVPRAPVAASPPSCRGRPLSSGIERARCDRRAMLTMRVKGRDITLAARHQLSGHYAPVIPWCDNGEAKGSVRQFARPRGLQSAALRGVNQRAGPRKRVRDHDQHRRRQRETRRECKQHDLPTRRAPTGPRSVSPPKNQPGQAMDAKCSSGMAALDSAEVTMMATKPRSPQQGGSSVRDGHGRLWLVERLQGEVCEARRVPPTRCDHPDQCFAA